MAEHSTIDKDETLDCGKPVNFTYYDNLVGVSNRHRHPNVPEPQVGLIFSKHKKSNKHEFDIDALERKLKKAKREVRPNMQIKTPYYSCRYFFYLN